MAAFVYDYHNQTVTIVNIISHVYAVARTPIYTISANDGYFRHKGYVNGRGYSDARALKLAQNEITSREAWTNPPPHRRVLITRPRTFAPHRTLRSLGQFRASIRRQYLHKLRRN